MVRRVMCLAATVAALVAPTDAPAQGAALSRAMLHETSGRLREAVEPYREALAAGEVVAALLGLERVFTQLGWGDSLVAAAASAVHRHPAEPTARTVLLRALHTQRRDGEARGAFNDWIAAAPGDLEPYRAWARLFLADGRTGAVDTLLREAQESLGSVRGLSLEVAQFRAALGQWDRSAVAWREAMRDQEYLETAAAFSLRNAPVDERRGVRAVLLSPPIVRSARKVLATLELGWGNGRDAWAALAELPLDDSTAAAWQDFSVDAERRGQYLAARDALLGLQRVRPDAQRALRAATLALDGGDARSALSLTEQAASRLGADGPVAALPTRLRAYALLGDGASAQREYEALLARLNDSERDAMRRVVAWAWVRGGGVTEARAMLAGATPNPDDEITGWLALYDGNLAGARRGLRRVDPRASDNVFALAFITRTRVDSAPAAGAAFLALARGDSAAAVSGFVRAAAEVEDAASVLLLAAARIHVARRGENDAVTLWKRIVETHNASPEAPEAELEWARVLRRRGEFREAIARLEHLVLTWPESALLPQARHELDQARAAMRVGGGSD